MIEIRLLGRFSIGRDGEEIPPRAFGGRLVRTLVRILVTRRGEFVSHDVLTEALWRRQAPADPAANLKVLVNRARGALGDASLIITGSGGYSFTGDQRCVVDAERFVARVEEGRNLLRSGQAPAALGELQGALGDWQGEPLKEDAYEDWAQEYRSRLTRAHLDALEAGAEAAITVSDWTQAVTLAERAVAQEPLREAARLLLVRALAASGDAAAALASFDRFRRALAEELGLDPSSEALDLQARILRGEPCTPPVAITVGIDGTEALDGPDRLPGPPTLAHEALEPETKARSDASGSDESAPPPRERQRRRLIAAPIILLPVLALAAVIVLVRFHGQSPPPSAVETAVWQAPSKPDSTYHCGNYSAPLAGLHGTVKFQECVIVFPTTSGAWYQGVIGASYTSANGGADTYTGSQEVSAGNTIGIRANCGAVTFVSSDRKWCFTQQVYISGHDIPLSASGVLVNQTGGSETTSSPNCVVLARGCRD